MPRDYLELSPELPGAAESPWLTNAPPNEYPTLQGDVRADIAVIGGGLLGVLTAFKLAEQGASVALVEARGIAGDVTGHTTAKITGQHGLLTSRLSTSDAERYLPANAAAADAIGALAERLGIECGFTRVDSHVYATTARAARDLEPEAELFERLGLAGGLLGKEEVPPGMLGAVRLSGQAIFDPVAFCDALAEKIVALGGRVFERSRIRSLSEKDHSVELALDGGVVHAGAAVMATHVPVFDTVAFSTRLFQYRTYAAQIETTAPVAPGTWFEDGEPGLAWRALSPSRPTTLVVSGVHHKAGQGGDERDCYRELFNLVEQRLPGSTIVRHWSTQDCYSTDGLPYVGRLAGREHVWVGSGFCGWGMSGSWVASEVLAAEVGGLEHELGGLLAPGRIGGMRPFFSFLRENADTVSEYLKGETSDADMDPEQVVPLDGRVMRTHGKHAAVWRDAEKTLHLSDAHCRHLRCVVEFNEAEQTWDCPCHGSRYLGDGTWLHGPTRASLETIATVGPGLAADAPLSEPASPAPTDVETIVQATPSEGGDT